MTIDKAKSVINELKLYVEDLHSYSADEVAEALEMSIKALEQKSYKSEARRWKRRYLDLKQRIFKLESEQKWISCNERLPESDGRYLVTYERYNEYRVTVDEYRKKQKGNYGFLFVKYVIAWMPLPEPYRSGNE